MKIVLPDIKVKDVFFLALGAGDSKNAIAEKTRKFNQQDWQSLYDFALATELWPSFYARLTQLKLEYVPGEFFLSFKAFFLANLKRSLILQEELFRIVECFDEHSVSVVPLKGPALAVLLYDDLALRKASCDLDVLVGREKVHQAQEALSRLGFQVAQAEKEETERNIAVKYALKYSRQVRLYKVREDGVIVHLDLHWDIRGFYDRALPLDIWGRLEKINIGKHEMLALTKENLLLYLCLTSISTFEFVELRYLYDIHMLITKNKEKLNWRQILSKIASAKSNSTSYFALKLTKHFFGTEIPDDLLRDLRPDYFKRALIGAWLSEENILYKKTIIPESYLWKYIVVNYLYAKDIFGFLREIYRKTFLPIEEIREMYGYSNSTAPWAIYLKRLVRPIFKIGTRGEG